MMMRTGTIFSLVLTAILTAEFSVSAQQQSGYQKNVKVTAATRIDFVYPLANQSPAETPDGWLGDYDSTEQTYELFVPRNYRKTKPTAAMIFISPGNSAMGWKSWQTVCEKEGIIFAGPHNAGNNCPIRQRVRIVLDVFDELRRNYNIDVDRTYIGGFSGGGRIACSIGFALPEYFGGVIPVCAAGDLREESWLRQRVIDRVSVAFLTGENDFNRGEVERFRGPILAEVGVRTKVWVYPKLGHGVPNGRALIEVHNWLDDAAKQRAAFAKKYPASRISGDQEISRADWAKALLAEAKTRLNKSETLYTGLMQLKGIHKRWTDLATAQEALKVLTSYDSRPNRPWEEDDIAEQRKFLIAQARGLDAYATGDLPKQYANQRVEMTTAAINLWAIILRDGQNKEATEQAKRRIPVLQALIKDEGDK